MPRPAPAPLLGRSARRPRGLPGGRAGALGILVLALALAIACGGGIEQKLTEARALQDAGDFSASIELLRGVLDQRPDHPEANEMLGLALIQTGQPSRALFPLEKARRDPEHAVRAGLLLASTSLRLRSFEDARRAADRVLEKEPERSAALAIRARANLGAKRFEEALADAERLVETNPQDYGARLLRASALGQLGREDEAEKAHQEARELAETLAAERGEPGIAARGCLTLANYYQEREDEEGTRRARETWEECADAHPASVRVLAAAETFWLEQGEPDRVTALWERALEKAPDDLGIRRRYADQMRRTGRPQEGLEVLREMAERTQNGAVWEAVARYERTRGALEGAVEAMDRALEAAGGGNEGMRFLQADILAEAGELERAREISKTLEQETFRQLIEGRVLLEEGEPERALETLQTALQHWPNNAGARYMAGMAALEAGRLESARSHLREAVRADQAGTDAALLLADLHLRRREYEQAASFAATHVQHRDAESFRAHVIAARALEAMGRPEAAETALRRLLQRGGEPAKVAAERAQLRARAEGPEAALAALRESGVDLTDPANEEALRALAKNLQSLGRGEEALARVDEALERAGEAPPASLLALRATVLGQSGRAAEAREAYRAALERDPENAEALGGLATLLARAGSLDEAVEHFDRAAEADAEEREGEGRYAYSAAQLRLAQGQRAEAERRLREVVREHPGHAGARNDLAWMLAEDGRSLDRALELAETAARLDESAATLDTLGWVRLQRGEAEAAVATFERALERGERDPSLLYHLAMAQKAAGDTEQALATFREAVGEGGFPEAEAARREIAALEKR